MERWKAVKSRFVPVMLILVSDFSHDTCLLVLIISNNSTKIYIIISICYIYGMLLMFVKEFENHRALKMKLVQSRESFQLCSIKYFYNSLQHLRQPSVKCCTSEPQEPLSYCTTNTPGALTQLWSWCAFVVWTIFPISLHNHPADCSTYYIIHENRRQVGGCGGGGGGRYMFFQSYLAVVSLCCFCIYGLIPAH